MSDHVIHYGMIVLDAAPTLLRVRGQSMFFRSADETMEYAHPGVCLFDAPTGFVVGIKHSPCVVDQNVDMIKAIANFVAGPTDLFHFTEVGENDLTFNETRNLRDLVNRLSRLRLISRNEDDSHTFFASPMAVARRIPLVATTYGLMLGESAVHAAL